MFEEYPDLVTIKTLCEMLGISKNSAYQLVHENKIRSMRIGRVIKIPKPEVIRYIAESTSESAASENMEL